MIHGGLYGLHLRLIGHIHLLFIECTRLVHINIDSSITVIIYKFSAIYSGVSQNADFCSLK